MTLHRRNLLRAGGVVLLLGAHQIVRGATVVAVRLWPAPDYTRLTIESDGLLTSRTRRWLSPRGISTSTVSTTRANGRTRVSATSSTRPA